MLNLNVAAVAAAEITHLADIHLRATGVCSHQDSHQENHRDSLALSNITTDLALEN